MDPGRETHHMCKTETPGGPTRTARAARPRAPRELWCRPNVTMPRSLQTLAALVLGAVVGAGCMPPRVGAGILVDPVRTPIAGEPRVPYGTINFESGDVTLSGWLFAPAGKPKGLVVFLHGRTANRSAGIPVAEALVPRGYAVFA